MLPASRQIHSAQKVKFFAARLSQLHRTETESAHQTKARQMRKVAQPIAACEAINTVWSIDFMHDRIEDGCRVSRDSRAINTHPQAGKPVWLRFPNPHLRIYT